MRLLLLLAVLALAAPAAAQMVADENALRPQPTTEERLCRLIESAAAESAIPVGFFTRLIWKESRFRSDAVSPKGAQGIAQFMPGTAAERGLLDPFDPAAAIPASAGLLADLGRRFGNLGLAAAAYNAGADRVARWLADEALLPWETEDYVLSITGHPAADWRPDGGAELPDDKDCLALAALLKVPGDALAPDIETVTAPWGVQVAGNFSRAKAIAGYRAVQKRFPDLLAGRDPMIVPARVRGRGTRPIHAARVPAETRDEAERICAKLRAAGGSCIVLKT
jgi:hypothetical protein